MPERLSIVHLPQLKLQYLHHNMNKDLEKEVAKEIKNPTPTPGIVDLTKTVEVTATAEAPYHSKGEKIMVAPAVAEKMKANGWAS